MGKDRVYLEDLIDVSPFVDRAEELVDECRIAAYASEDRKYDTESIVPEIVRIGFLAVQWPQMKCCSR